MKDLTPIETKYNNRLYRSRLEARWAVFFDAIGIKYEYEYEGFELSNGQRYLPDFWFPSFDCGLWGEVKPDNGDFFKAKMFADTYGERIWLIEGSPAIAIYKVYIGDDCRQESWNLGEKYICGIPNWDQAEGENRMFIMPCYFKNCSKQNSCRDWHPVNADEEEKQNWYHQGNYFEAVEKALSYRF